MRLIRWMIVAIAMAGGIVGLAGPAGAAPLPNTAAVAQEAGSSRATPAQFFIYRRPNYGYRRRYYGYRPYYRPYYGYRRPYYGYRPYYYRRPIYRRRFFL